MNDFLEGYVEGLKDSIDFALDLELNGQYVEDPTYINNDKDYIYRQGARSVRKALENLRGNTKWP